MFARCHRVDFKPQVPKHLQHLQFGKPHPVPGLGCPLGFPIFFAKTAPIRLSNPATPSVPFVFVARVCTSTVSMGLRPALPITGPVESEDIDTSSGCWQTDKVAAAEFARRAAHGISRFACISTHIHKSNGRGRSACLRGPFFWAACRSSGRCAANASVLAD